MPIVNSNTKAIGTATRSKKRAPHRDVPAPKGLDEQRVHRADEDGESEQREQQVVGEENAFTTRQRVEARRRSHDVRAHGEQHQRPDDDDAEESEEGGPDRGLREAVDGEDRPRAGQERTQDRQRERGDDEDQIPGLEHAAATLHDGRMEERGGGEKRQECSVFDGVPRPVTAPPENLVRPPPAEQDPECQKPPCHDRPSVGSLQPNLSLVTADQRRHGKGRKARSFRRSRDRASVGGPP